MRLVNDYARESVWRELCESLFLHHGLDATNCDAIPRADACLFRLLPGTREPDHALYLVSRLVEQFAAMREHERAVALRRDVLDDLGERYRLAAPGSHDEKSPAFAGLPLSLYALDGLMLIWPKLHATNPTAAAPVAAAA